MRDAAGEVWVGPLGVRVHVRNGKAWNIDLLPIGGKPKRSKAKDPVLAKALTQIKAYLQGKRRSFSVPLEQPFNTAFHSKVYSALMTVPYGHVISYGELAHLAGAPGAARAVGTAMKRNRLCVLVPCHRVVAANGIGGYNGQIEWKKALLGLEKPKSKSAKEK
jgi:methylated-DNA-[protein]-cysteine S-methyltransferase